MTATISLSLGLCGLSIALTLWFVRSTRRSLGLPFAYLMTLNLNHAPGAYAHLSRPELFGTTSDVEIGIWQTAVGNLCFVFGLLIDRSSRTPTMPNTTSFDLRTHPPQLALLNRDFWLFCLFGGWSFVFLLAPLQGIPTIGAMIEKGGAVWMLGAMLGLRNAVLKSRGISLLMWLGALAVYPALMLLLGGFLSYGSAAAIIVLSGVAVSVRRFSRVFMGTVAAVVIGLSIFVNYFIARDQIRAVAWSDASFDKRVSVVAEAFRNIEPINLQNDKHAMALDERLNQNYFAGLAAFRIDNGYVDYRYGQSLYEAAIALIPRAVWPDKPVFGGSGSIVKDMTGLPLPETTSWGVGQVMEFYTAFGWPSLILGFGGLGWILARLDYRAAAAERSGDAKTLFVCFLPAVALIQPLGSMVELVGGAFAAYLAAIGWSYGWKEWSTFRRRGCVRSRR